MKIGIYSPYLDTLGGGERYILTMAEVLSGHHEVDIFWDSPENVKEGEKRFTLDLSHVTLVPNIFKTGGFWQKCKTTGEYDLMLFLSDGSVPFSFARRNIIHFQVPFPKVDLPLWKSFRYKGIICNSEYTKQYLDPTISVPRYVIYPPVPLASRMHKNKRNLILSVGRFSAAYDAKKYRSLIRSFRTLYKQKHAKSWKLVLAGGLMPGDISYFNELKRLAKGLPVEFHPNCSSTMLSNLYNLASIYWHAAGYGETSPVNMEHFGISTVEAMGAGCVVVVYGDGGQKEIVADSVNGFTWKTESDLIGITSSVILKNYDTVNIRLRARERALHFTKEIFSESIDSLIRSICHIH